MDRLACVDVPSLRSADHTEAERAAAILATAEWLRSFTPGVEPSAGEAGIFWLDASGLGQLYPSLEAWAQAIRAALQRVSLDAICVVGWSRFAVYALAKARPLRGLLVLGSPEEEGVAMRRVSLARVGLPPEALALLRKLAITTVGEFLALPPASIRRRFGAEAQRIHQLALGAWAPLQPVEPAAPVEHTSDLDDAERDRERLTFLIKGELDPLLTRLRTQGEALVELTLELFLEGGARRTENIRPAEPTLDGVQLLGLVRLRLESLALKRGVVRLVTRATGVRASRAQLEIFAQKPRRDLAAASRAIARIRASLGDQSVVRARLREAHLPEASFVWEPVEKVVAAHPRDVVLRPLVRRAFNRPAPLPPRPSREPDGWLLQGVGEGPVDRVVGPHYVSGGWWQAQVERDYYYAELRSGALCWVYYDRRRRCWFMQGEVA